MQLLKTLMIVIVGSFVGATSSHAGDKEDALIDRTIGAYGGEHFRAMKSLVITDRYKGFRFGQSNDPASVDEVLYDARTSIDFQTNRKSLRWISGRRNDFSVQHQMFNGKAGYSINHTHQTMTENSSITFANADRRNSYFLDTALLQLLDATRDKAVYLGEVVYSGKMHEKISFQAENYPEMTLYLDRESGLISTMIREHWVAGEYYSYQYSDYRSTEGVLYAGETYVTRGGLPYNVLVSRVVEVNSDIEMDFVPPQGFSEAGKALDFSSMVVKQLSDDIFLVGKDWGFSLFIDAGDYFIALGGYEGLQERFDEVKAFSGKEKPLKYQVVSHHHLDHLGGMKEAAALGANFITVKEHIASVRENVGGATLADNRFLLVDVEGRFADGKIQVLDFPNSHASHHLVIYIPEAKMIFTADMFLSRQETGAPPGYSELIDLRNMLKAHHIDAEFFAAAHSSRILTADDLAVSISNIKNEVCPADWVQCANW